MTTASELFYNRRSRIGRNSLDPGLDSSLDRTFHPQNHSNRRHHPNHLYHHNSNNFNNNTRRDRHDLDGCDTLRRSPSVSHPSHRSSYPERDTVRFNEGSSQSSSGNIINSDNHGGMHNRLRVSGNDRLPGAVLLARERLLERLRGVSLSGNRQSSRASLRANRNNPTFGNDFRPIDAGDWETEISREWLAGGTLITDSISHTDQLLGPQEISKRPPGLTQAALDCLQMEVFSNTECRDEAEMLRTSHECGICLESFMEGDELICLPCGHRFHSGCLDPWVRTCGDCPYCRRGIVATSPVEP